IADEAVVALEEARADLQAQLDAIHSSRSWRLTEALRKGGGAARRWAAPLDVPGRRGGAGGGRDGGDGGDGGGNGGDGGA
ncbi:MAG TPA: hypothetical protein VMD28_04235, partial [Acidimicrobiales bacterium]|nr:hypothetical protein [Acidimicrobiales bacterium]